MPRKKVTVPEKIKKNTLVLTETINLQNSLFPTIFHAGSTKILICLARAYQDNYGLTYSRLSELTNLKKRQFDYPINALKRQGLVRVVVAEERPATTVYEPTDAGLIVARGVVRSMVTFLEPLVRNEEFVRRYPMIVEGCNQFKELEVNLQKEGTSLNINSLGSIRV